MEMTRIRIGSGDILPALALLSFGRGQLRHVPGAGADQIRARILDLLPSLRS